MNSGEILPPKAERDVVALRDYVDAMFDEKEKALVAALSAQEKAVAAALEAADKAVTKAEVNAEKWRENANEWRGAMSDRDRELPSRREVEQALDNVGARLTMIEKKLERGAGRREGIDLSAGVLYGAAVIFALVLGAVIALVTLLGG